VTVVYLFWFWLVFFGVVVFVAARSWWRGTVFSLFRPLVLTGFSASTLFHIHGYLRQVLAGSTDAANQLGVQQAAINPLVHVFLDAGSWRVIERPVWKLPMVDIEGCPAEMLAVVLWNHMVADLLLGNLFWLVVCSAWLWFVGRRNDNGR
jgi:hypothetical protein